MKVEIIDRQRVFDDFFKIDAVTLRHERFSGGMSQVMRRLNFERGDSVAALVWNRDSKKVILTEQFRYPTYEKGPGWLVEVVAGVLKEKEEPEAAVIREIFEETGYQVDTVHPISTFYVSPGGTSERIHLYYTEVTDRDKKNAGGGLACEHEDIRVMEWTWSQLQEKMTNGDIIDAKTLIACMWFQNHPIQRS